MEQPRVIEVTFEPPMPVRPNKSTVESVRRTLMSGLHGGMLHVIQRRSLASGYFYTELLDDQSVVVTGQGETANVRATVGENTLGVDLFETLSHPTSDHVRYTLAPDYPLIPIVEYIDGRPVVQRVLACRTRATSFLFSDQTAN